MKILQKNINRTRIPESYIKTWRNHMNFSEQYTERLNLNISPLTYKIIKEEAENEGRKIGNMARIILDRYVMGSKDCEENICTIKKNLT